MKLFLIALVFSVVIAGAAVSIFRWNADRSATANYEQIAKRYLAELADRFRLVDERNETEEKRIASSVIVSDEFLQNIRQLQPPLRFVEWHNQLLDALDQCVKVATSADLASCRRDVSVLSED